jgi:hypothetical protein
MLGAYLANRPTGQPAVYLIVAVVLFALALVAAGLMAAGRNGAVTAAYRALVAGGLGCLALALLTH